MISQVVVIGVSGMALAAKIVAVENRYGCEARPVAQAPAESHPTVCGQTAEVTAKRLNCLRPPLPAPAEQSYAAEAGRGDIYD
jgi:hypothetical protein